MKMIVFHAPAICAPCKKMAPIVEELKKANPDLNVKEIDIQEDPGAAEEFNVMSIPTFILLNDKEEVVKRKTGVMSLEALTEFIKENK